MEYLLRSKGLYRITMGKEIAPTDDDKKSKWDNRNDEAPKGPKPAQIASAPNDEK
jgi:hypothetical protein